MENALIIFAKNPELGKVKTRLAKTLGNQATLKIYKDFIYTIKKELPYINADIHLFNNVKVEENDIWGQSNLKKHIQLQSGDLGEKMIDAFRNIFDFGYKNIIIIGSDCPYLNANSINMAFTNLIDNQLVIGPSKDGGFYLLGINNINYLDFKDIEWSTSNVTACYMKNLKKYDINIFQLEILEDIDEIESYNRYLNYLKSMNNNNL